MASLAGQSVTQRDLAEAVGLDPRTVRELTDRGILTRDKRTQLYPVGVNLRALRDYWEGRSKRDPEEALDYNRERARLTFEQANRAARRYQTEAGRLVAADAAQLALEHVLVPVRQYFQEQGDRLAPDLVGLQVHEIKAAIDSENASELGRLANPVLEFTGQLADPELDLLADDPDGGEPPAREGDPSGAEDP